VMPDYPGGFLLTVPDNVPHEEGTFLLPVCITQAELTQLLTYYEDGMLNDYYNNSVALDFSGAMPILEAMAFVNQPDMTACGAVLPGDGECRKYLPNVGWITYAPNDPFQTPEFVPEGYILPPWYNNPLIPLPGVVSTDAMVNFASLPVFASLPEMIESGLPRCRIEFSGTGELEVEFVQVPQGGYVLVTVDGNPLNNRLYDLNAVPLGDLSIIEDIFDIVIGQNLNATVTAEFEFVTDTNHFVDCTFLPQVSVDTLVGFGGGIRRVSLCGLSEIQDIPMPQMQRVGDCEIQWRPTAAHAWVTLIDDACGENGTNGTDGASVEMRIDSGFIQWRQSDNSPTWTNLIAVADLVGAPGAPGAPGAVGDDGASVELRVSGGFIQWRQDDNNPTWANLIAVADLVGAPGEPGQDGLDGIGLGADYYPYALRCRAAQQLGRIFCQSIGWACATAAIDKGSGGLVDVEKYLQYGSLYPSYQSFITNGWWGALQSSTGAQLQAVADWMFVGANQNAVFCAIFSVLNLNAQVSTGAERTAIANSVLLAVPNTWTAAQTTIVRERIIGMTVQEMCSWLTTGMNTHTVLTACDDCVPDQTTTWTNKFSFRAGQFLENVQVVNGTWASGDGWRENASGSGAEINFPFWTNSLCLTADSLGATSVRLEIWDIARNQIMATRNFTEPDGGTVSSVTLTFDWQALYGSGGAAEQGVKVKVFGTAGFTGYRGAIAGIYATGRGDAPPVGSFIDTGCV